MNTPDSSLPPLDAITPKRNMVITIEVAADFEKRLDNQWMVEREINADRWSWQWADATAQARAERAEKERDEARKGRVNVADEANMIRVLSLAERDVLRTRAERAEAMVVELRDVLVKVDACNPKDQDKVGVPWKMYGDALYSVRAALAKTPALNSWLGYVKSPDRSSAIAIRICTCCSGWREAARIAINDGFTVVEGICRPHFQEQQERRNP